MLPSLIHPVWLDVEQVDQTLTQVDPDFREVKPGTPIVFGDPVRIRGQIKWGVADRYRRSATGDMNDADGHIAFLRVELERIGLQPQKGDRVTECDDSMNRYELVEVRPVAHYNSRHTMVLAFFKRLYGNS